MKNLTRWNKNTDSKNINQITLADFKKVFGAGSVESVNTVFEALKGRFENPRGNFDNVGRFYLSEDIKHLSSARTPSRSWPYSEMNEARTRKFIMKVWIDKDCKNINDLKSYCFNF
ncbi:hypothetical protein THIOSC15_2180001 [uncultured Thiomicrorhabdus sp.]